MKKNTIVANTTKIADSLSTAMNRKIRVRFTYHRVDDVVYPVVQFQQFVRQCVPFRPHWITVMDIAVSCLGETPHPNFTGAEAETVGNRACKFTY
jgi:hypothetical protein